MSYMRYHQNNKGILTKNGKLTRETLTLTIKKANTSNQSKNKQSKQKQAITAVKATMSNQAQLKELNDKLSVLENALKGLTVNTTKDKKPRNMTDAGALHKAKLIYYQEMKNSAEVKAQLKTKDMDSISFKNWRTAKDITDEMFDKLSQAKKDEYVKKAQESKA